MLQRKYYKELDINGAENISSYLAFLNEKWNLCIELKSICGYDRLIGEYQSLEKANMYFIVGCKRMVLKNKLTGICYRNRPSISSYPKDSIFYGLKAYDNCEEVEMCLYGIVNRIGEITIPLEYESITFCSSVCIFASREGKCGVLDLEGHEIVPFEFDDLYRYSEGLIGARKNDKIGFIDGRGKEMIPFIYDAQDGEEYYFQDGLACVAKEGEGYGYINHNNEEVFNFGFDFLSPMTDGACVNLAHESNDFGYTNDKYLLMANGEMRLIDSELVDASDGYVEFENNYCGHDDSDKMDAYEGDYDALWNTD